MKVEGCEFILHIQDNRVVSANGILARSLNFDVTPSVSENAALATAMNNINASKYGWEVKKNDTTYWSNYPQGELIFARTKNNKDFSSNNYKLTYKFTIMGIKPDYSSHVIYIDAITGKFFKKVSLLLDNHCTCCSGTAQTLYNGQQTITTRHQTYGLFSGFQQLYDLRDFCRASSVILANLNGIRITDKDNEWSAINERPATSGFWAAEMTADYYFDNFGRKSFDNAYAAIEIWANESLGGDHPGIGAKWDSQNQRILCGAGEDDIATAFVSLDIIAHEFTHAVTQHEANLVYEGESGALNESFSDIFGTMVEFFAQGGVGDYELGEDVVVSTDPNWLNTLRRSMQDPDVFNDPDTYEGDNWVVVSGCAPAPSNDYCGVHTNSGIQNFWFFLLSEGGSGTNDNGDQYCIDAIGRDKAALIAYHNLSSWLTSTSQYVDARNGSIQAASDIYGHNSNEVAQVTQAWYAVGVGAEFSGTIEYNDLTVSGTQTIAHNNEIEFNNLQVTSTGDLTVTSNTRIVVTAGSSASSGSSFHAFITPACAGAAKTGYVASSNTNQNNYINSQIDTTKSQPEEILSKESIISIHPNPTTNKFTVHIPGNESPANITVKDVTGRTVRETATYGSYSVIDLTGCSKGLYFIKIIQHDRVFVEKIVYQ